MMASKKRAPPANSEIIREQIQLLAAEKELKATLDNIKDQINKLLVCLENTKAISVQVSIIMHSLVN